MLMMMIRGEMMVMVGNNREEVIAIPVCNHKITSEINVNLWTKATMKKENEGFINEQRLNMTKKNSSTSFQLKLHIEIHISKDWKDVTRKKRREKEMRNIN